MALTPEQLKEILDGIGPALEEKIGETVVTALSKPMNDAISKRLGQFEKTFSGTVESSIGKALDGFKQTFVPQGGGQQEPAKDPNSVALKTLETKLETALTRLADADSRARSERTKNRSLALTSTVADHLSKLGMTDPVGLKLAVGHLTAVEKRAQYENDEDDNARILFRNDDDTLMDLGVGLKKWAATPEAKHFLPPSGAKGSGSAPAVSRIVAGQTPTREQQESILFGLLNEQLGRDQ